MNEDEARRVLEMIEESRWRMSRGPAVRKWRPPADELNPGSFKPQNQTLGMNHGVDGTVSVTHRPGGLAESTGQTQFRNLKPLDAAVSVHSHGGKYTPQTIDGGVAMLPNLRPLDGVSATDSSPSAVTVNVSSQNFHLAPGTEVRSSRPAIGINVDSRKHGGVPTDHNVR